MTIAIPIQPDIRPAYGRNPAYAPIIGMTELAFENTAKWLDGNKTARMLYPATGQYNDPLGYSGDTTTIQGFLTSMASAMSGWGYSAKNDTIAASGTRKYVIPPFCRSTSLAKLRITQGVSTGTGVTEIGTIGITAAHIGDDTVISLYKSASTARIGFFNRTGANWALDTSTEIASSGVSSITQLLVMSSTKFAAIYYDGSVTKIIIFTISGTVVTAGSAVSLTSSNQYTGIALATTDVIVALQDDTSAGNAAKVRVITVSGTVPTVNAMVVCPGSTPVRAYSNNALICGITTNIVAVGYLNSGTNKGAVAAFTVSGSSGSFGTAGSIGNTSGDTLQRIVKYSSTEAWLVYDGGGGTSKRAYSMTIGVNVTMGTDITIESAGSWNMVWYDNGKFYAGCNGKTKRYTVNSVSSFTLDFSITAAFSDASGPPSLAAITSGGTVYNITSGTSAYYLVAANISIQVKANVSEGGDETAITLSGSFLYQYTVDVNSLFYRKVFLLITNNDSSFAASITVDNIVCETI